MSSAQLDAMMELSQARAQAYLRIAKVMVMNEFGPYSAQSYVLG